MGSVGRSKNGDDVLVLETPDAVEFQSREEEICRQLGHIADGDGGQDEGCALEPTGIEAW